MRRSRLIRYLLATTLPVTLIVGSVNDPAIAEPLHANNFSAFGMPGGIDTPTAETLPDGTLGGGLTYSDYAHRNFLIFQATPRLTALLRYSKIEGIDTRRGYIWDRSFDVRFRLLDEKDWRPAVSVGLQDFLGTGHYSAEYVVATKTITPTIRASAGLGWGRLAGDPRPFIAGDEGGKPNVDDWFTGDVKPFGSISWQVNNKLSLIAEYSNDEYEREVRFGEEEPGSHINLAANYQFGEGYNVSAYTIGGKTFGAQFSVALNPQQAPFPSGLEPAPAPVRPRPSPAADPEGWSGAWSQDPTAQPAIQKALSDALADEGQTLESMALSSNRAEVRIRNNRYIQYAEAIGRTARLMSRALPPSVDIFVITISEEGVPTSSVTLRRSDVERLENTEAGKIASAAVVTDAVPNPGNLVYTEGLFPRFRWSLKPYFSTSLFDPDEPFRYEVGAQASASYEIQPGLILSGAIRQRLFGSIEQEAPDGLTVDEYEDRDYDYNENGIPIVRSDNRMYSGNTSPTIPELTLAWFARPTDQIYTRVTVGLLETAYGGISTEALWKPVNSPLAFGVELNRVRKREFDGLFGFRNYEVTTGHASVYYEFGQGYTAQLDVGQYLAGDQGATLAVQREFANGWRIGAYATKTDMSEEDFGEGSFDKGITLSIPIAWATGQPSQQRVGGNLRSLSRDGGAKLRVDGRLYERVRDSHSGKLYEGWGKFWR